MKDKKILKSIIKFLIIIIIIASMVFTYKKLKPEYILYDIKIYELYNNPLAGRRIHEERCLRIDPRNCIGQVTYLDMDGNNKATYPYSISKEDIDKMKDLAQIGTDKFDKTSSDTYTVYAIHIGSSKTYVDSSLDKENVISSLFKD